jgi:hypothetical protein
MNSTVNTLANTGTTVTSAIPNISAQCLQLPYIGGSESTTIIAGRDGAEDMQVCEVRLDAGNKESQAKSITTNQAVRASISQRPCKCTITWLRVSRFMESSTGASRNSIDALLVLLFKFYLLVVSESVPYPDELYL